jgi:transcriptional regulator with GAF, ATPase, and Fis domain
MNVPINLETVSLDTPQPSDLQPSFRALRPNAAGILFPQFRSLHTDHLEALLLDALVRTAAMPIEEVEREMEIALKRVSEVLELKYAALWRISPKNLDSLELACHSSGCHLEEGSTTTPTSSDPRPALRNNPAGAPFKIPHHWTTTKAYRGKPIFYCGTPNTAVEADQQNTPLWSLGGRSGIIIPLFSVGLVLGAVSFGIDSEESCWPPEMLSRLEAVAGLFAHMAARKFAEERLRLCEAQLQQADTEIKQLKERLQAEGVHVRAEPRLKHSHENIIGRARAIKEVLRQVEQVAPADCPVLITGETGTGKELVAHELHKLSRRKDRNLVLINCAALPSELVESELFGRERGAYTGALTKQTGRFELAHRSTIFLDEIGEFPMELQAKLLRVLQQGEFQRLGSPQTYKVDVRVIAATNRDLVEEVRKGRFREDLYYRLRVFPIELPPLRNRAEDIPALAFAFVEEFARRMGKDITTISRKDMETLQAHSWPGNIRELRNVIERSVIVTSGATLNLTGLCQLPTRESRALTMAAVEREHITKTLENTNWRIKGPHGAAVLLDMEPSTLYSRIHKLGITLRPQKNSREPAPVSGTKPVR